MQVGEYYVGGHVKRTGVYSMTGRTITLRQALIAAGGAEENAKIVEIVRKAKAGTPEETLRYSLDEVMNLSSNANPYLSVGDQIMVQGDHPTTAP